MFKNFYFKRNFQSEALCADFLSKDEPHDLNCLFLSSPKGVGKTSFLINDLIPNLRQRGANVAYCDLWSQESGGARGELLVALNGVLVSAGLHSLSDQHAPLIAAYLSSESEKSKPNAGSVTAGFVLGLLRDILEYTKRDLVLILDEAQDILDDADGMALLTGMRALMSPATLADEAGRLRLICTGSYRDKLNALLLQQEAPFFGAHVQEFPRLGREFVEALTEALNARFSDSNQLDVEDVDTAFSLLGNQPATLIHVLVDHALGAQGSAGLRQTITQNPDSLRLLAWQTQNSGFEGLTALQRRVLEVLLEDGSGFSPFAARTLARIGEAMGEKPSAPKVQKALDGLRERGIVWRPGRGRYALQDQDMREWLGRLLAA